MMKATESMQSTFGSIESAGRATAADESRSDRVRVLLAVHRLEAALGAAAPGREEPWIDRVVESLRLLKSALAEAPGKSERRDGLWLDIERTCPRLMSRLEGLQQEYDEIRRQIDATLERLLGRGKNERTDFSDIRQRVAWLVTAIRHHQAREADLIFEAFNLDIGVGD